MSVRHERGGLWHARSSSSRLKEVLSVGVTAPTPVTAPIVSGPMSEYEYKERQEQSLNGDGVLAPAYDNRPPEVQRALFFAETLRRDQMSDWEFVQRNASAIAGVLAGDPRTREQQQAQYMRERARRQGPR